MNTLIATSEELSLILEVTKRTFNSYVNRGTLDTRLKQLGFQIVDKYKEGRITYYELAEYKELTLEDLAYKINIRDKDKFAEYATVRTTPEGLVMTRKDVSDKTDIRRQTIRNWDTKLEGEHIMSKDRVVYRAVRDGKMYEITLEEYKRFWENNRSSRKLLDLLRGELEEGYLTPDAYESQMSVIISRIANDNGYTVHKFQTYKEAEKMEQFLCMLNTYVNKH